MIKFAKALITISLFMFMGCGAVVVISDQNVNSTEIEYDCQLESFCEECLVQPESGYAKDIKWGYYYNQEDGKCELIQYSSGPGCIPPPFRTQEECVCCCEEQKGNSIDE